MRWLVKKAIRTFVTVFVAISLTFVLIRLMPGSPIDRAVMEYVRQGVPEEEARIIVSALFAINLTRPIHEQYFEYIVNLFQGDMGTSLSYLEVPVVKVIAIALPWTVFLLSFSLSTSFLVGVVLGSLMAYLRETMADRGLTVVCTVLNAMPNYILGIFILYYLCFVYKIFPESGAYDIWVKPGFTWEFISNVLHHAAAPFLAYFITSFGGWALGMRGSTVRVLGEDYVMAAEARGLRRRRVMWSYVARNAILPPFTSFIISLGYIFGGSVLIESLFTYPGIGYYLNYSISQRDYPLMQGCFLIITLAVICANFIADIVYAKLDPRIRIGGD